MKFPPFYLSFARRPLFWLAISLILGILFACFIPGILSKLMLLVVVGAIYSFCFESKKIVFLCLVFLILGICLIEFENHKYLSQNSPAEKNNTGLVEVSGEIVLDLKSLQGNDVLLQPHYIDGKEVGRGLILLKKDSLSFKPQNGDLITTKMFLYSPSRQRNPGGFCYYTYLKQKGVYSLGFLAGEVVFHGRKRNIIKDSIVVIKQHLLKILDRTLDPPYNQVMKALLFGERDNLPEEWGEYFSRAGANHLLAISGLHVGFITLFLFLIFRFIQIKDVYRNSIITLFMLFYVAITGGRPSVVRAGLLSVMVLWSTTLGRRPDLLNILGLTALLNLIIDPYALLGPGFQLTYLVLLSIVSWTDLLKNYLPTVLIVSLSAQLGSVPITAYFFNQLTPAGLLTNIWAIPLSGVIVFLGLFIMLLGLISLSAAGVLGFFLVQILRLFRTGMAVTTLLPGAYLEIFSPSVILIFIYYFALFWLATLLRPRILPLNEKKRQRYLKVFKICCFLLAGWLFIIPLFNNTLKITVFDVGQGDSIFLELPNNSYILVDGGDRVGDSDMGEYVLLPYFRQQGIKNIDFVFITHFHSDHATGIKSILRERNVKYLVLPAGFRSNRLSKEIRKLAQSMGTEIIVANRAHNLKSGKVIIDIFHPCPLNEYVKRNDYSIVKKIEYGDFSLLLTGDLESSGERELLSDYERELESCVLKVGHHGSNTSSTRLFLQAVSPKEAIISVGIDNRYGHPDQKVIDRLQKKQIRKWRTDKQGAIIINTKGTGYEIESFLD